ncbi:MAG: hypothetical protein SF187_15565 [Deltaproteobacteria bacterium]|nr:hypothetical protein [Deltaproteobacteria bacterium]
MSLPLWAATLVAMVGCTSTNDRPTAAWVTLFNIKDQLVAGSAVVEPLGLPMKGRYRLSMENNLSLDVIPAFDDGEPAAYVTTEYWQGFSDVWVQPMYVMAQEMKGVIQPISGALPVFSVGADSAFYSPYWRVFFVVVPPGAPTPDFRTTRAVLDSGYPLVAGPGRLCSLAPSGTDLTGQLRLPTPVPPLHPLLGTNIVGGVGVGAGWVDGISQPVSVVSFGDDRFTFAANGVVNEDPLYVFRHQATALSGPKLGGLPSVGGRGPAAQSGSAPNNRPSFGSYWRLHFVDLPSTAGVVVPQPSTAAQTARIATIMESGLTAAEASPGVQAPHLFFRPVLDAAACAAAINLAFNAAPAQPIPATVCRFLDSEAHIQERLPPAKVVRSEITATCPFVTYQGQPVPLLAPAPGAPL